ncbi:ROK family protein [Microbispora sp. H13382]|uniref:ROK family protein n=1 Tax=Microbispora sp. H13382 TaxID=2729112 RepID=UPI0015FF1D30|nr:ROK family protein [Microbispora sp. H13382]
MISGRAHRGPGPQDVDADLLTLPSGAAGRGRRCPLGRLFHRARQADRHLAARAELAARPGSDTFAYLHLGEGLACAIVSDGRIMRGLRGLAGEIAHLMTAGPDGRATALIEVFGLLGLRQPGACVWHTHAPMARKVAHD